MAHGGRLDPKPRAAETGCYYRGASLLGNSPVKNLFKGVRGDAVPAAIAIRKMKI